MKKNILLKEIKKRGYKILDWNFDIKLSKSLYYPNNLVVLVLEKKDIIYRIETCGDIIFIKNQEIFDKTNEGLSIEEMELLEKGKAKLENNNWFEISMLKKGAKNQHCELNKIAFDLREIFLLLE